MRVRFVIAFAVLTLLLLGACGGSEVAAPIRPTEIPAAAPTADALLETVAETVSEEASDAAVSDEVAPAEDARLEDEDEDEGVAAASEASDAGERPAWQQLPITNARTGESFTLADFAGKTVYVEPFATWCTKCRQQLNHVNQARANFGDDVVFLALSVEPNIGNDVLAQYATDQGFDLIFGAMSPDLLRETVAIFGQTLSNPPATPHFIIRADGSTTELFTGIESPEAITSLLRANQG